MGARVPGTSVTSATLAVSNVQPSKRRVAPPFWLLTETPDTSRLPLLWYELSPPSLVDALLISHYLCFELPMLTYVEPVLSSTVNDDTDHDAQYYSFDRGILRCLVALP